MISATSVLLGGSADRSSSPPSKAPIPLGLCGPRPVVGRLGLSDVPPALLGQDAILFDCPFRLGSAGGDEALMQHPLRRGALSFAFRLPRGFDTIALSLGFALPFGADSIRARRVFLVAEAGWLTASAHHRTDPLRPLPVIGFPLAP